MFGERLQMLAYSSVLEVFTKPCKMQHITKSSWLDGWLVSRSLGWLFVDWLVGWSGVSGERSAKQFPCAHAHMGGSVDSSTGHLLPTFARSSSTPASGSISLRYALPGCLKLSVHVDPENSCSMVQVAKRYVQIPDQPPSGGHYLY